MSLKTKTLAEFVSAIEDGTITDVLVTEKKPGANRVIMVVRVGDTSETPGQRGLEVWDVGS